MVDNISSMNKIFTKKTHTTLKRPVKSVLAESGHEIRSAQSSCSLTLSGSESSSNWFEIDANLNIYTREELAVMEGQDISRMHANRC